MTGERDLPRLFSLETLEYSAVVEQWTRLVARELRSKDTDDRSDKQPKELSRRISLVTSAIFALY